MGTFVELCAGTAALTFAMYGQKPPVSMAGSKRTLAPVILPHAWRGTKRPDRIVLVDAGEWGCTLRTLFCTKYGWDSIADVLESWQEEPEKELFDRLRLSPPSWNHYDRAATHLYLQSRTFRGKPVYPNTTGWVTHGFDPEYRAAVKPGAKDRGFFNARPTLVKKLRKLGTVDWPEVIVRWGDVPSVEPIADADVYFDPPYQGTLDYGPLLDRTAVFTTAERWRAAGCRLTVSERVPLAFPGTWEHVQLATRKAGTQLAVHQEWLTISR